MKTRKPSKVDSASSAKERAEIRKMNEEAKTMKTMRVWWRNPQVWQAGAGILVAVLTALVSIYNGRSLIALHERSLERANIEKELVGIKAERDNALNELRDARAATTFAKTERADAIVEKDRAITERNDAITARNTARIERDAFEKSLGRLNLSGLRGVVARLLTIDPSRSLPLPEANRMARNDIRIWYLADSQFEADKMYYAVLDELVNTLEDLETRVYGLALKTNVPPRLAKANELFGERTLKSDAEEIAGSLDSYSHSSSDVAFELIYSAYIRRTASRLRNLDRVSPILDWILNDIGYVRFADSRMAATEFRSLAKQMDF